MVNTTADGSLYAFVVTKGLLRIRGNEPMWTPVSNQFGGQVLVQLSASANEPDKLVGLNQFGKLISSDDGGASWQKSYPGNQPLTPSGTQGEKLFATHCQSCHGLEGVGETYTLEALTSEKYIMAPALDYSAHAWHHTDEALVQMILEGSQRTERMTAWGKQGLTEQDAKDLIVYMKSLWGKRELDCQGPKHMQCM
ncbi:MAG: cytochrome c [Gammaproteobacteria bacterium]|nr:cytochrome c [Gammaproteobacteria bacterium]